MTMGVVAKERDKNSGRLILFYFVAFFGVIVAVNAVFITLALDSHSGVIMEQPYEKGLAFNAILDKAKRQPNIDNRVSYDNGVLRWGLPIHNASVSAKIVRLVKSGADVDVILNHIGGGIYEARPSLPFSGTWTAYLKAMWGDEQFQVSYTIFAK